MFLTLTSALNLSIQTISSGKQGTADVQLTVEDTRPFLFVKHVGVTVDWGDGSPIETVDQALSPYTGSFRHFYKSGTFVIKIKAKNYQVPNAESVAKTYDVKVAGNVPLVPSLEEQGLQPVIYGPILPREAYPNADEWRWNLSQDSIMLESSARLLLLTPKGERLMQPDYGTRIRQFLFNQSDPVLSDDLTQEIRSAFAAWLPQVDVGAVNVQGISSKEVSLSVRLISRIDQRPFQIATTVIKT